MEDSGSSNAPDAANGKAKKERPKSLDLESSNLGNEEENKDDTKSTTSRKSKDFSSSQEDLLESPDDGEESGQRTTPRSKSITQNLKSKIRDLSPSRRATPPGLATKPTERKTSKGNKAAKSPRSPGNWLPASFNQIFSSYKTKCGDFKRLFKELPESEQLIVDYSCALQRDILVHGRLYISQNWLCFYANIFGWETFVTIQCTEITSIRKEKTALVIPNAVQVCTDTEKYFFASFISRDTAYTVLFRIWQNALLDQPLSLSELIQAVGKYSDGREGSSDNDDSDDDEKQGLYEYSGSEGDMEGEVPSESVSSVSQSSLGTEFASENQTGLVKDGEIAPVVSVTPPSPGVQPVHTPAGLENGQLRPPEGVSAVDGASTETQPRSRSTSPHLHIKSLLRSPGAKRRKSGSNDSSKDKKYLSSDLDEEGTASEFHEDENTEVPVKCVCDTHLSKEFVNEEFPVSVDTLYEYLFTESDFYKRVQKARRTKDLVLNPWETTEDGQRRTITYTVSLNHAIGPKHSPTTEQQHCLQGSVAGKLYVVQAEVNNEGIPYGDSFSITTRYCLTKSSNTTSRLRVSAEVTYQKSVWGFVRNMIEKNALEGLEGYFQFLVESLRRETTEGQWPKKRRTSPTRRHKRNRSLKNKEVMEPATEASKEVKTSLLQRLSPKEAISRLVGVRSYLPQVTVNNPLAIMVTFMLGALLLLNLVLVYRLLLLEHATQTGFYWDGDVKNLPADAKQWAQLLQQQKRVQEIEMRRWRDVLASSIQLMNQVQQSLDTLQIELDKEQTTAAAEAT